MTSHFHRHFDNIERMAVKPLRLGPLISPEVTIMNFLLVYLKLFVLCGFEYWLQQSLPSPPDQKSIISHMKQNDSGRFSVNEAPFLFFSVFRALFKFQLYNVSILLFLCTWPCILLFFSDFWAIDLQIKYASFRWKEERSHRKKRWRKKILLFSLMVTLFRWSLYTRSVTWSRKSLW